MIRDLAYETLASCIGGRMAAYHYGACGRMCNPRVLFGDITFRGWQPRACAKSSPVADLRASDSSGGPHQGVRGPVCPESGRPVRRRSWFTESKRYGGTRFLM